jgi:hypothetical protein
LPWRTRRRTYKALGSRAGGRFVSGGRVSNTAKRQVRFLGPRSAARSRCGEE